MASAIPLPPEVPGGWGVWGVWLGSFNPQLRAALDGHAVERAGAQLQGVAGAPPAPREASWPHALRGARHAELAIVEDDVEREAHREGVDHAARVEDEPVPVRQAVAAQQALHARRRRIGQ